MPVVFGHTKYLPNGRPFDVIVKSEGDLRAQNPELMGGPPPNPPNHNSTKEDFKLRKPADKIKLLFSTVADNKTPSRNTSVAKVLIRLD
jgi:hypothetical protein